MAEKINLVMSVRTAFEEKIVHRTFELIAVKGVFAFFERAAGIALYSVNRNFLTNLVLSIFHDEFQTDPHDIVANTLTTPRNPSPEVRNLSFFYIYWPAASPRLV